MPSRRRLRAPLIAVVLVLTLVLAAAGTFTIARLFDGGSEPDLATNASFVNGAEVGWSVAASDLLPQAPGMGPPIFTLEAAGDWAETFNRGSDILVADEMWVVSVGYQEESGSDFPIGRTAALVGLDPDTGAEQWRVDEALDGCVVVGGDAIACLSNRWQGSGLEIVLIDALDGTERWREPSSARFLAADDGVVVGCSNQSGVMAMDSQTGRQLWSVGLSRIDIGIGDWHTDPLCAVGDGIAAFESVPSVFVDVATGALILEAGFGWSRLLNGRVLNDADVITLEQPELVDTLDLSGVPIIFEGPDASYPLDAADGSIASIDPGTGQAYWEWGIGSSPWSVAGAVVQRDGIDRLVLADGGRIMSSEPLAGDSMVGIATPGWVNATDRNFFELADLGDGIAAYSVNGRSLGIDAFSGETLWDIAINGDPVRVRPPGTEVVLSQDRNTLSRIVPGMAGTVIIAALPSVLPGCPDGTIELARGELADGWVLVCGYHTDDPTYLAVHSVSAGDYESTDVRYDAGLGRYTANLSDGSTTWLEHTPSTLGIRDPGGVTTVQESVLYIYFVDLGEGGQAQGTGAYGIDAPDHTAQAQVEYFSQVLQRSEAARAELGPAVQMLLDCGRPSGDYSTEIDTIGDVRDNRAEQRAAIQAAPVDLIPDGTALVDELSAALAASYDADVAYLDWALDIQNNGCSTGTGGVSATYSDRAGAAKTIFADHWNAIIAPVFGVPTVSRETL
ncbi:MAG: PQQ-binding-like beta-propeller repeat protein [Beutenbergiaceae bacterium]